MLMVRFLKNSRHHLSDVLEAPGQQRGRLIIVSFAPFHPVTSHYLASVGG
jgi:hypothetical protein